MPSASPLYSLSIVFTEPETPFVLSSNESSDELNNSNDKNGSSNNDNYSTNTTNMDVRRCSPANSNSSISFNISSGSSNSSTTYLYDPFKCLRAMTEQSLTGNFKHSSSESIITDESSNNSSVNSTVNNSRVNSTINSNCTVIQTDNNINNNSNFINLEQQLQYLPCDKNTYLSLTSNSSLSSKSPPLSPTSSSSSSPQCMYTSTPVLDNSSDFLGSVSHKINEARSSDFLRNESPFCESSVNNQESTGDVINSHRTVCKKSYPFCSSDQILDESDRLFSWTLQHPEDWSNREVLDWVFCVAQERGLDMQEFRGENFQAYTGAQLCHLVLEDFTRLEPKFGKIIYGMFQKLLSGDEFQRPTEPDNLSSSCIQMTTYSPASSPNTSMDIKCYPQPLYLNSASEMTDCNGATQNTYFKQERCSNMDNGGIDLTSYDFDLDDTPCITTSQCPAPPFHGQVPRRRPGRPRVKNLINDDRVSKEKKVKNQHLWEFIHETLMNPIYNPQFLRWENQRDGVFRFVQSEAVAQLWGGRKNNENMTYEKLSRAMRHYYRRGILERVEGRRLVYKFSLKAMERIRDKKN